MRLAVPVERILMMSNDERESTLNQLLVEMDGFGTIQASSFWQQLTVLMY
jgi:ATP-dependent Zn protease